MSDKEKAQNFISVFKTAFTVDDGLFPLLPDKCPPSDIQPDFFTNAIRKSHLNINSTAFASPDGLPGKFWHSLNSSLAQPLSILLKKFFTTGILPDCWKKFIINSVYKKGDSTLATNYRPIALTSIVRKTIEALIKDALLKHLTSKNVILTATWFLKQNSTGTLLLDCLNDWSDAYVNGECVDVYYIDFAKAFDSLSIPKLIFKLKTFGITGSCLSWLTNFLSLRKMCVKVNDTFSDYILQFNGVPQGCVLKSLSFVLYINDLPENIVHSVIKLYADDIKTYYRFPLNGCTFMLQNDLDALAARSKLWQLNIAIDKTFIMHIGKNNPIHVYTINSKAISVINAIKDLGMYISNDLTWNAHVTEIVKKANRLANTILHSFHSHDVNIYLRAFDVFVQPILDYCCFIWNPTLCYDTDSVENVQNAYTRRVFRKCMKHYANYENRLAYLK